MTKQKSLIGTELDCILRTVEISHINRLDSIFNQASQKNTHLLYPSFLLGNLINLPKIYKVLSLNINNVLLSRESIISHKALKVGDAIKIRTFLRDAYEQQASSNPIGFVILETIGLLNNDVAFYGERVIAVRGGFHRGRSS